LEWRENDRALASFENLNDILNAESMIRAVTVAWIRAAGQEEDF